MTTDQWLFTGFVCLFAAASVPIIAGRLYHKVAWLREDGPDTGLVFGSIAWFMCLVFVGSIAINLGLDKPVPKTFAPPESIEARLSRVEDVMGRIDRKASWIDRTAPEHAKRLDRLEGKDIELETRHIDPLGKTLGIQLGMICDLRRRVAAMEAGIVPDKTGGGK